MVLNLQGAQVNIAPSTASFVQTLIQGDVHYSAEDQAILTLIDDLQDEVEALRLRSELDLLKDEATPPETRKTASQKLKAFLFKAARGVGKRADAVGIRLLTTYLEGLVTGK